MAAKEPNKQVKPDQVEQVSSKKAEQKATQPGVKSQDDFFAFQRFMSMLGLGVKAPENEKKEKPLALDPYENPAYPGADFHIRGSVDNSFTNFQNLATVLRSGSNGSYNFAYGNLNFEGFSYGEFSAGGKGANWSKFDVGNLPKIGSVKNIKLDGSFQQAFQIVLASEGGFANHKNDRGGATIYGIASAANPREYKQIMDCLRAGDKDGAMQITMNTYKTKYWDKIGADNIQDPAARLIAFDAAINHGAGYAAKMVARTGADADSMLRYRANTYANIIDNNPSQQVFEKGWSNRLAKLDTILGNNPGQPVLAAAKPDRTGPALIPS